MPNDFDKNWRRLQELKMRPHADKIYRTSFGDELLIERYDRPDNYILDREFATDVKLTFDCGLILTGQEKYLSCEFAKYRTVTVEYMQNPETGEKGDWFKLGVQFYFTGYSTEKGDGFYPWVLLNWASIVVATYRGIIKWAEPRPNGRDGARANFKYIYMDQIPKECIIDSYLIKNSLLQAAIERGKLIRQAQMGLNL